MLNISFAFRDATRAVTEFGEHLEIPSLVPAVFMMQRDVINHYRSCMGGFTISLNEPGLQNSSFGSPYQKWAHFGNMNHRQLSFMIQNLLSYTSRLVHETECNRRFELRDFLAANKLSNSYTYPICDSRYRHKQIGFHVHDNEKLTVTWIRTKPRPERPIARCEYGGPTEYFFIEKSEDGTETERPISKDEYQYFTEWISQSTYEIRDRRVLDEIKERGMSEIDELESLNKNFQIAADSHQRRDIPISFAHLRPPAPASKMVGATP